MDTDDLFSNKDLPKSIREKYGGGSKSKRRDKHERKTDSRHGNPEAAK